jgi:HSP20 family molecular chaperone IbpA
MSLLTTLIPSIGRAPAVGTNGQPASDLGATLKPRYEVTETDDAYGLAVFLPGISKDQIEISAEQNQLRIVGRKNWKQPEGWTLVYRESPEASYELALEHDNAIDADKINADLRDGVLRVSLPKSEGVKPRKIVFS